MRNFINKILIFFSIPTALLLIGYFYFDPYKVIYTYHDFNDHILVLNRDYISTEKYIQNRKKHNYDSFIFGSSRTIAFKANSWKKHLNSDASVFSYDASGESIFGIYQKLKFITDNNYKIKNVVILLCRDISFEENLFSKGHLFKKHPLISGNSKFAFQFEFIKAYFTPKLVMAYYEFLITNEYKPQMKGLIPYEKVYFNKINNQIDIQGLDTSIEKSPQNHLKNNAKEFYERKGEQNDSINRIDEKSKQTLIEIKKLLTKHNVNYKIVTSPLYDQVKFSKADSQFLNTLFGKNFYDFTGKNEFTSNKLNYYESSHYRPIVGDKIFEIIYNNSSTTN